MTDLEYAKKTLSAGGYTLVIAKGETVYTSKDRGVKPLVRFCKSGADLKGFSAADKVVGRATAFLYVLLNIEKVYAVVLSKSALEVLNNNGVKAEYDELVENIINRKGDGICPFEETVLRTDSPKAAYEQILNKCIDMNIEI